MFPFVTSKVPLLGRPELEEEYTQFLYEILWIGSEFAEPVELESYFLSQKTSIRLQEKRDVTLPGLRKIQPNLGRSDRQR